MRRLKTKIIVLTPILLGILSGGLFVPSLAEAETGAGEIGSLLLVVFYFINSIVQTLLGIGGKIMSSALSMNYEIAQSYLVGLGWTVVRDLTNLGFVLIIIFIAFLTMLRMQNYNTKEMLWKLIAAALLVNFSLVIAGWFIDFSNVASDTFFSHFTDGKIKGTEAVATALMRSFQLQNLAKIKDASSADAQRKLFSGAKEFGESQISIVVSLFMVIVFSVLAVLTFFALAAMLVVRWGILQILLIIMPIVWLLWILPFTAEWWRKWWRIFLGWVFFVPILAFFLYLAAVSPAAVSSHFFKNLPAVPSNTDPGGGSDIDLAANIIKNLPDLSLSIALSTGLLLMGLIISSKLGVFGASLALTMAQKAKGFAIGSIKGAGKWAKTRALTAGAKPEEKKPSFVQGFADKLSRIPGFRGVAGAISGAVAGAQRDVDARGKKFNDWSDPQIKNYALSKIRKARGDPVEDAALLTRITKSKDLLEDKDIEAELPKLFRAALKTKSEKAILEVRPDMAKLLGKGIAEEMAKKVAETMAKISASKTSGISAESFKDELVVLNLNLPQLSNLARDGSDEQKNNIIETLLKADRSALKPEDVKKLDNLLKNIPKIPNWQDVADRLPKPQSSPSAPKLKPEEFTT